jgi:hypothetical protein
VEHESGNNGEDAMKWLEVIQLRSAGKAPRFPREVLSMVEGDPVRWVKIEGFRHAALETDWSLHLYWESEHPEPHGSPIGLRLAQMLKEFGLVHHSVWVKER